MINDSELPELSERSMELFNKWADIVEEGDYHDFEVAFALVWSSEYLRKKYPEAFLFADRISREAKEMEKKNAN